MHPRCLLLLLRALVALGLAVGSTLGPSAEAALAGSADVTSTTVSCSGLRVQSPSTATACTATVASAGTHAPTGTVSWSIASGGGSLSSASCALAGSGLVTSCSIIYTTPASAAVPVLEAAYSGAASVAASTGVGELGVCPGGSRPTISIDGNNADWGCVSALFGDDPTDAGGGSGDLTFMALSADGTNLYARWDEFMTSNANALGNDGFSIALDTRGGTNPNYLAWVLVQPSGVTTQVQVIGGATTPAGSAKYTCDWTPCVNGQSISIEATFPLTAFGVSSHQTVGIQGQTRASASTNSNVKDCIPGKTDCSGGAFLIDTATGAVTVKSGDTTATAVACSPNPGTVGAATTCTATVTDTTLPGTQAAGLVTWTDNAGGTFGSTSCSLSNGACAATYTPAVSGSATVTAVYSGNTEGSAVLRSSSGSALLTVADAAGSTPTATPTPVPTDTPTPAPTATPVPAATNTPTATPTSPPPATATPTSTPTSAPTSTPTVVPTSTPTTAPTSTATPLPTGTATSLPTSTPSSAAPAPNDPAPPAATPGTTAPPTSTPTPRPTNTPTAVPTNTPTARPTSTPTNTPVPTDTPVPTVPPTITPVATAMPELSESLAPTSNTLAATASPTSTPLPIATPTGTPIALGSLSGSVTDAQTGAALARSSVQVQNIATGWATTATTAEDGRYAFASLAEGSYTLTFAALGYTTATASSVVAANASGAFDQALATSAPACAPSSGPRTIAPEIARHVEAPGELYFTAELDCFWTSGRVTLSADQTGSLPFDVDDALELEVQRPDGSLASWSFDFSNACTVVTDADPQDISALFQPGVNHLWLRLYDQCGTDSGNSPLYLSGPSPASNEPPPSLDDLAAVLPVGDQDRDTPQA